MSPEIACEPSNPDLPGVDPEVAGSAPLRHTGGSEGATCSGCDSRWTGRSRAHCPACHQTFGSVGLFDRHRRSFACLDPAEVGMEERDGLWRGPEMTEQQRVAAAERWSA